MGGLFSRRCRYCQEDIKETDTECPHCGEKFPEDEPPIGTRTLKAYHKGMSYAAGKKSMNDHQKEKKQFCFIASAAYGTPWSSEVNHLRYWRDSSLSKKKGGLQFICLYYKISPPFALLVYKSSLLKAMIRYCLNPLVHHIKKNSGNK